MKSIRIVTVLQGTNTNGHEFPAAAKGSRLQLWFGSNFREVPSNNEGMKIKIASPCPMRWEDMSGNDRSRFCQHCSKHVYNLSNMTSAEISALIQEKEGNVCARIYQRPDVTVMTADCPVGAERFYRRLRVLIASAAAAIVLSLTSVGATQAIDPNSREKLRARTSALLDDAIWKVKGWFGIQKPRFIVGKIASPSHLSRTNAPATPTTMN